MSLAVHVPSRNLFATVWKLLRLSVRLNFNNFRRAKTSRKILILFGLFGLLVLVGFIFWGSWALLGFLRSPKLMEYTGVDPAPFLDAIPAAVFSLMFLGTLFTSFGVLLQALYLSGDLDFLLAAPVPIRAVFITKLLQAVLPNVSLMAIFGLPLLWGLGASRNYNVLFYPLVPLMMIAQSLAAASLSSLLVMLIVRLVPAKRVAEVLGFVGAIISITISQSGNLMRFSRGQAPTSDQMNDLMTMLIRFNNPFLPLNWAGRGLVELGSGNWIIGILLVVLTLALFSGGFWFALVTAERWYYTGWARMQVVSRKKRGAAASHPAAASRLTVSSLLARILPAPTRGILQKDLIVLRRDLRNLSQLVTPLIFGVIYAASFLRDTSGAGHSGENAIFWTTLLSYSNVGVAVFVGWNLLARLGSMSFSQEGKSYWLLKAAPVTANQMLLAKFLLAYIPTILLGLIFLTGISMIQSVSFAAYFYSVLMTLFSIAAMTGLQVGMGAVGAKLDWEDARKMNAGAWGCLGMLGSVLAVAFMFALFVGLPLLAVVLSLPIVLGHLLGLLFGAAASVAITLVPMLLARPRIERLGEV